MIINRINVIHILIGIATLIPATTTNAISLSGTAVFNGLKWVATKSFQSNTAIAQAGPVVIDTVNTREKGWYANSDYYDLHTIKNGYKSAPASILDGEYTTRHSMAEMDYSYYDMKVYQVGSNGLLYNPQTWIGNQFWEPTVYLKDEHYYVMIGTTKSWDTTHRVLSFYSNASGDQGLRNPGTYNVTVHYTLMDVSITPSGLTYQPQNKPKIKKVSLSAIQNDDQHLDLLQSGTCINQSPYATGKIVRKWGWQFAENPKINPYTGDAIWVEWAVQESIQE